MPSLPRAVQIQDAVRQGRLADFQIAHAPEVGGCKPAERLKQTPEGLLLELEVLRLQKKTLLPE